MKLKLVTQVVLFFFCFSCLHVEESRTVALNKTDNDGKIKFSKVGNLIASHVIYHPDQYPLESFFSRLADGEFISAFQKISLWYEPSNTDSEMLEELLDQGFVPVYLSFTNHGSDSVDLNRLKIRLKSAGKTHEPIANDYLPRIIEEFNVAAAGANVYNTSVIVVSFVAIFAVMALAGPRHGPGGSTFPLIGKKSGKVYNSTTRKTNLEYNSYLYSPMEIAPEQTVAGILFFKIADGVSDWDDLKLSLIRSNK